MIVILPRRVSLLVDQLPGMFFTLSIFSEKMASQNTSESFKGSSECDGKFGAMRCLPEDL